MKTDMITLGKYKADGHTVIETKEKGLVCDCGFNGDCDHITAVLKSLKQAEFGLGFRIMERSKLQLCKFCSSGQIVKAGKNRGRQMFKCQDCKKRFTANFGFEGMRHQDILITRALQMYYQGLSVRDIASAFELEDVKVSHVSIYKWIKKYSKITSEYLDTITPHVGSWFRADEVWVKIDGQQCYLFASMDDETRYWIASDLADTKFQHNADSLLEMTKQHARKKPKNFITDGLPAYKKSARRVFGKETRHISDVGINSRRTGRKIHVTNNKMERLNGEIRDREKVFRGLKRKDTEILNGMKVYYNFTKKHGALYGRTPAEQAGIKVDGPNKWRTIIQNASLNQILE